ncbi:hypothetical protein [Sphingobacterium sp. UBA5670]|uniref:hypothetical protein n=1 Tax=Sphingobacterium sp. UBA5670 TaxID=1947502 RepID=UPI0025D7F01F|nr:hypothetical protein [Sphingobacterium sp. UBA5670]
MISKCDKYLSLLTPMSSLEIIPTFPYLLIVEGKYLDQVQLEAGQRLRMKTLSIHPHEDLPINTIEDILQAALNLYRDGIIKIKK